MEGFFLESLQVDLWTVEFCLRTYGNSLDLLPFDYGVQIIKQGFENVKIEKYWSLYVHVYPLMTEETYVPFSKFMADMNKEPEPTHSAEEILDKTKQILNMNFKKEVI